MTTSKYKICRRLGPGVYEKCQTQKFVISQAKRKNDKRPKQLSDFGTQLIEKQKVRFSYGVSERQMRNYVRVAMESRGQSPADKLFELLESRLDNIVYRLGIAHTRALARQIVAHGHILVNGKRLKVASHLVGVGDVITPREESKKSPLFTEIDKRLKSYTVPNWLKLDSNTLVASVQKKQKNTEGYLNLNTVIEFYSR